MPPSMTPSTISIGAAAGARASRLRAGRRALTSAALLTTAALAVAACASPTPPLGADTDSGSSTCYAPVELDDGQGRSQPALFTNESDSEITITGVDLANSSNLVTTGAYLFPGDTGWYSFGGTVPPNPEDDNGKGDYRIWAGLLSAAVGATVPAGESRQVVLGFALDDESLAEGSPGTADGVVITYTSGTNRHELIRRDSITLSAAENQCEELSTRWEDQENGTP